MSQDQTTALVERLRLSARGSVVLHHDHYRKDCADAADEIERLRKENMEIKAAVCRADIECDRLAAIVEGASDAR
jgi:hypothetical protein